MESADRMPKGLYVGAVVAGWVVTLGLGGVRAFADEEGAAAFTAILVLVLIGVVIAVMQFWYKAWWHIQDGHARTSPGQAVGFAFIPLFNLYWIFQMIWGLSVDFNKYLSRHGLPLKPLPEGMFLAIPILALGSWIPFLGTLASLAAGVLSILVIIKVCDTVNDENFRIPSELAAN
jgi:hypothetical protein